jgi:aconitate hydratase
VTELNDGGIPENVSVVVTRDGSSVERSARVRIDTPGEADYYRNGGILQYVLRNMLKAGAT